MSTHPSQLAPPEPSLRFSHQGREYQIVQNGLERVSPAAESASYEWSAEGTATHPELEGVAREPSKLRPFLLSGPEDCAVAIDRPLLVGRSKACDVILDNHTVSRFHAVLLPNCVSVRVLDLGSQNGTKAGALNVMDAEFWDTTHISLGSVRVALRPLSAEPPMITLPSAGMAEIYRLTDSFAGSDAPVVILGESGVGKESLVERIHATSGRTGVLVAVNAATLTPALARSELFGHTEGAFTGAQEKRKGAFELADGGTLFLDEICDLPPSVQAELLRALDSGEVVPLGASEPTWVDTRLIVASNVPLETAVNDGKLREDLYYRLSVLRVCVPALRNRLEDIPVLAKGFLHTQKPHYELHDEALEWLMGRRWTGNIRELRTLMVRAALLAAGPEISKDDLMQLALTGDAVSSQRPFHSEVIDAWRSHGRSPSAAAKALGIHRATVHRHLRQHRKMRGELSS